MGSLPKDFRSLSLILRSRVKTTSVFHAGRAGLKPPAQFVEVLRTDIYQSDLSDFHVLRQGFIPTDTSEKKSRIGKLFLHKS